MLTITLSEDNSTFPYPPKGSKIHITDKVPKDKSKMVLKNFRGHRGMGNIVINFYSRKGAITDIKTYDAEQEISLGPDHESYFISLNPSVRYSSEELIFDLQFL